jgi:hypothetical protein
MSLCRALGWSRLVVNEVGVKKVESEGDCRQGEYIESMQYSMPSVGVAV